jgi:hypothetical protein
MAAPPILYDLFWRTFRPPTDVPIACGGNENVVAEPAAVPAMILFPALVTPAVHLRDADAAKDRFEILLAAQDMPVDRMAHHVNMRLKLSIGFDPWRQPSWDPLFENPAGQIEVTRVTRDGNGILRTPGGFRGILHPKFQLPQSLDTFYAVRIAASCLAKAKAAALTASDPTHDLQDQLVEATLRKLNGPALRGGGKQPFGMNCFSVAGSTVNLAMPDPDQPIRAYHPLFVYGAGELGHANLGHVSDLHINGRQQVLRQSDARVIDVDDDSVSPRIGSMVNVYSSNFQAILRDLRARGADVFLIGGDLIDHVRNCCPWPTAKVPVPGDEKNAGKIWKLLDLDDDGNYERTYQAFVDHLSFYSIVRDFCTTERAPLFAVAGNHDAYDHAYGMSPRVLKLKRANEGIAADHNLTFYEAMLAFGESYGTIKKSFNFNADLFEWFFNVLTPFSDYAVELPRQRVVGLHWGEDEEMISAPWTGHGFGHLPRANKGATAAQVALAEDGFRSAKKTVLFTHFTFVSYDDKIPGVPAPVKGEVGFGSVVFGKHDFGTFEQQRAPLYGMARASAKMQCVLTGHSHRKGLYFLAGSTSGGLATEMYPIPMAAGGKDKGRAVEGDDTPIVVSDCGGPLPRINVAEEFKAWGSDRPSGTLVEISARTGKVDRVLAVPADAPQTLPRVAVSLEYLHVLQGFFSLSDEVFGRIMTVPFRDARPLDEEHALRFPLGKVFERTAAELATVGLFCKPSVAAPWIRISLRAAVAEEGLVFKDRVAIARVPRSQNADFVKWLTAPAAGRFMALTFRNGAPPLSTVHAALARYDWKSPWAFEVDCWPEGGEPGYAADVLRYVVSPRFESPNFDWRRKFPRYQS